MDVNECNSNHLDPDVRLPPRKRLLAGLKKQSCLESNSRCSQENNPSSSSSLNPSASPSPNPNPNPNPSISATPLSEFDVRLNILLKSYKNGSNMSPEEIAEAAKSAAEDAAKAAEVARKAAEEKAAVAVKAVSSAKSALDLVASISDGASSKDKQLKKNKLKKHVPVQLLYSKYQPVENCGTDEELARKLHRAINSSPRISKHSPRGDKSHEHKKVKISPSEKNGVVNGGVNHVIEGVMDFEGSNEEISAVKVDDKVSKFTNEAEVSSVEAESSHTKENTFEKQDDVFTNGRKRGRIKQKKLPLSICSSKDQSNPKEDPNLTNSMLNRVRTDKPIAQSVTPIEARPTWKCQNFKVSHCLKQDKVVQS